MLIIIIIFVFTAAFLGCYAILSPIFNKADVIGRLRKYDSSKAPQGSSSDQNAKMHNVSELLRVILNTVKDVGNLKIFDRYRKNIQAELWKAHIPLKGEEFIVLSLAASLVSTFAAAAAAKNMVLAVPFAIAGWLIPGIFVKAKKKKRLKLLNEQLGDTIGIISNSLKSGYSFFQAIDTVTSEMSGIIAEEFAQLKKEINIGVNTETALENLVGRVESDDMELVVTAILIQRQIGGNLAEILDNISDTIRQRIRIKGEIKTMTAQGRISGIIIALIPLIMGLAMFVINPEYIKLLFTNNLGLAMVAASVVMELIGVVFIRKIVNIEL